MDNNITTRKSLISEGLFLTMLPALGLWAAYLYKRGFYAYFGIPIELIDIDINDVITAIMSISFASVMACLIFDTFVWSRLKIVSPYVLARVGAVFLIYFIVISYALITKVNLKTIMIFTGLLFPIATWDFFDAYFRNKKTGGTYEASLANVSDNSNQETLVGKFATSIGMRSFSMLGLLIISSFLSYSVGGYEAMMKEEFAVLVGPPATIVLARRKDDLIAAKFNLPKKTIDSSYFLVPIEKAGVIIQQHFGRLAPTMLPDT